MREFISGDDVILGFGMIALACIVGLGWLISRTFGDCCEEISPRNNNEVPHDHPNSPSPWGR